MDIGNREGRPAGELDQPPRRERTRTEMVSKGISPPRGLR